MKLSMPFAPGRSLGAIALVCLARVASAQEPGAASATAEPISDNSFLIEEAYNQDAGVVQHISGFTRSFGAHDWSYCFSQEWPLHSVKHQLSYTVLFTGFAGAGSGFGDLALNYRYQLVGDSSARLAISPRISLLLPTGQPRDGRGLGATGAQLNLPVSIVVTPRVVAHSNIGATFTPHAQDTAGREADVTAWSAGQGIVWLTSPRVNLMLEALYTRSHDVIGAGRTQPQASFFVSPGIRWAYDFKSGLQVVPGLAFPIGVGPSAGERQLFVYVSFEHPFRRQAH